MYKFKVGDLIRDKYSQKGASAEIIEVDTEREQYKLKVFREGYSVRFTKESTENNYMLVGSDMLAKKVVDNGCKHEKRYTVHMQSFKSFVVCPCCKKDLGDA